MVYDIVYLSLKIRRDPYKQNINLEITSTAFDESKIFSVLQSHAPLKSLPYYSIVDYCI